MYEEKIYIYVFILKIKINVTCFCSQLFRHFDYIETIFMLCIFTKILNTMHCLWRPKKLELEIRAILSFYLWPELTNWRLVMQNIIIFNVRSTCGSFRYEIPINFSSYYLCSHIFLAFNKLFYILGLIKMFEYIYSSILVFVQTINFVWNISSLP